MHYKNKGEIALKFDYKNVGDIVYGVENFKFRLKGKETADITLKNFLDEQYAYVIQLEETIPAEFKMFGSENSQVFNSLDIEFKSVFKSKEEALQHAVNTISEIVSKTEKI